MQWFRHPILAAAIFSALPALASAGDATPTTLPNRVPHNGDGTVIVRPGAQGGEGIIIVPGGQFKPWGEGAATFGAELIEREKGAYLGISATPPPAVLRKQLALAEGMGLVVEVVMPDSPAAAAGLKKFDVLQKLDDQLLINSEQLAVLVRSHKPGDEIKLAVIREGKPLVLAAKLVEHELEPLAEVERMQDEVAEQMRRMLPQAGVHQILPGGNGPLQFRVLVNGEKGEGGAASFTLLEGDRSYTINTDQAGHKTFIVKDKEGKSVFEGLIDTPEQRAKLPEDLKGKLEHMEQLTPKLLDKGGELPGKPQKKDGEK